MRVVDASLLAIFMRKEPGWENLAEYIVITSMEAPANLRSLRG